MLCPGCGKEVGSAVQFCEACSETRLHEFEAAAQEVSAWAGDAGALLRIIAYWFDWSLLMIVEAGTVRLLIPDHVRRMDAGWALVVDRGRFAFSPAQQSEFILSCLLYLAFSLGLMWLYYACFECSRLRATPGKLLVGIGVVSQTGEQISFVRASARYAAKAISFFTIGIGLLMVLWTERRQALHDLLTDCFVVRAAPVTPLRLIGAVTACIGISGIVYAISHEPSVSPIGRVESAAVVPNPQFNSVSRPSSVSEASSNEEPVQELAAPTPEAAPLAVEAAKLELDRVYRESLKLLDRTYRELQLIRSDIDSMARVQRAAMGKLSSLKADGTPAEQIDLRLVPIDGGIELSLSLEGSTRTGTWYPLKRQ